MLSMNDKFYIPFTISLISRTLERCKNVLCSHILVPRIDKIKMCSYSTGRCSARREDRGCLSRNPLDPSNDALGSLIAK